MPLERCQINGASGWRWGKAGKCYAGPDGKKRALKQAVAAGEIGEGLSADRHEVMTINRLTRLLETTYGGSPQVDRDAGVIRQVKVLGRQSKNGREYSGNALQQAAKIYEGLGVNFDHRERDQKHRDRKFAEGAGWLESVSVKADGVYADLHVFKAHPSSGVLFETAERRPERFGLSHDADGSLKQVNGKPVVESIEHVFSVDIVQAPATNRGLFESEELVNTTTLRKMVEGIDVTHPDRKVLLSLLEMDMVPADTAVDLPSGEPELATDADTQVKDAFRSMIVAAFDDKSLNMKATLARIKEILEAYDKLTATPAKEESMPPKESTESAKESIDIERKRHELHAAELLEAAGIKPDPKDIMAFTAKVHALASLTETSERKALIESWKPIAIDLKKVAKPAFSRPLTESSGTGADKVIDGKSFASAILNG